MTELQGKLRQLLAQSSVSIFNVNIELWGEMLTLNCDEKTPRQFAELDVDNDGLLSSTKFAEMAKLAQLGRHEL